MVNIGGTALTILLLEPLVPGRHLTAVHDPRLCYEVFAVLLALLLAIGFLRPLDGSSGLGVPRLGVKGHSIRFIPPHWNTIAIPVLDNEVRLEQAIVPYRPLFVRGVAKYYGRWRMPYFRSGLEKRLEYSVVVPN